MLQRLHSARIGCERVASCLSSSLRNIERPNDKVALKVKQLSSHLQGIIDCVEKKLYDLDSAAFVSSWLPVALVYRTGLVGRPRLVVNLVQVEFLRTMALFVDSNSFYSLHLQDQSLEASKGSRI